jgi:uncharacterized protein YodC (DUF2158 family)
MPPIQNWEKKQKYKSKGVPGHQKAKWKNRETGSVVRASPEGAQLVSVKSGRKKMIVSGGRKDDFNEVRKKAVKWMRKHPKA